MIKTLEDDRRDAQLDFGLRLHDLLDARERELFCDYLRRTEGHLVSLIYPVEPAAKRLMEKIKGDWQARYLLQQLCRLYGVLYE